jgi:hypothetical protein
MNELAAPVGLEDWDRIALLNADRQMLQFSHDGKWLVLVQGDKGWEIHAYVKYKLVFSRRQRLDDMPFLDALEEALQTLGVPRG